MIVELILELLYRIISVLLTPIQIVFQPLGSLLGLTELLLYASIFIPLGTFSLCLGAWVAFYGLQFIITVVNWLIAKIPTIE